MDVKFCPKCGNKLEDDSEFCDSCGYSLEDRKKKDKDGKEKIGRQPSGKSLENATSKQIAKNNLLKAGGVFFLLDFIIGVLVNYSKPEKRLRIMQNASKTVVIRAR